jgi:hypothetical protein
MLLQERNKRKSSSKEHRRDATASRVRQNVATRAAGRPQNLNSVFSRKNCHMVLNCAAMRQFQMSPHFQSREPASGIQPWW